MTEEKQKPKTVLLNDVKKGWQLLIYGAGMRATMADNAKGVIRMIETKAPLEEEIGSTYADTIDYARPDDNSEWMIVVLSERQAKQMEEIRRYNPR